MFIADQIINFFFHLLRGIEFSTCHKIKGLEPKNTEKNLMGSFPNFYKIYIYVFYIEIGTGVAFFLFGIAFIIPSFVRGLFFFSLFF